MMLTRSAAAAVAAAAAAAAPIVAAAAAAAAVLCAAPAAARADSGRLNLHLDAGYARPLGGVLAEAAPAGGLSLSLRADVAVVSLLAIEVGYSYEPFFTDPASELVSVSLLSLQHLGGGVRLNILDDQAGWLGEPGGNVLGTLWASVDGGVGFVPTQDGVKPGLALDAGLGYSLSLVKPLSVGLFARFTRYFVTVEGLAGGRTLNGVNVLSFGVDVAASVGASPRGGGGGKKGDADGDGLSDAEEDALGTDPTLADSDVDGVPDGVEKRAGTDPLSGDSDSDGLGDGEEDKNKNGKLDPGETDPKKADTDGGGVNDGAEVKYGMDPLKKGDDNPDLILKAAGATTDTKDGDADGVADGADKCPGTSSGETVDGDGCLPLGDVEVLFGLGFKAGELDPATLPLVDRWVAVLRDHPDLLIEVGGHADGAKASAVGLVKWSKARAEAVKARLVAGGIPEARLLVKAYGGTAKLDKARTPAAIEGNNRVELKKLGPYAPAPPVPAAAPGPPGAP
jgi:outer membrane protein OmpA-like peptidoglycan-associated protein